MSSARVTNALPPDVNPVKATLAFGTGTIPRLLREIQGDDLLTVQKGLYSLCDVLRNPQHISPALAQGVPMALVSLTKQTDHVVRELATEGLVHLSGHAAGRMAIVNENIPFRLRELFSDSVAIVRENTCTVLQRTTSQQEGALQLAKEDKYVNNLLDFLLKEQVISVKNLVLQIMYNIMRVDTQQLLDLDYMKVLVNLLNSSSDMDTLSVTAGNVMMLCAPLEGKDKAVSDGAVAALATLLKDADKNTPAVLSAATGALMTITITTPGKKEAIKCGTLDSLARLLEVADERVILNSIKLITVISEDPKGRQKLQSVVPRLTELLGYEGKRLDPTAVSRTAKIAIDTITWKP